jgi:cephalosporin hydroxylase
VIWIKPEGIIEFSLSSEIEAKNKEVEDRLKAIFSEEIDTATNEDYGSGSLSPERKKIFTVHKAQIENETILAEIKQLIKLLVKGEKLISETYKRLDKKALVSIIKKEYQNGSENKKKAYMIVNQVDNQ